MLQLGTLKGFDSTNYRAEVQLAGSMAAYLDNIPVARNIASDQMAVGRHVILAIPGGNPKDACVIAVWDGAAGGGGGGGGVTDHGALTGLADDDHDQYLNNARHDLTARHPLANLDPLVCSEAEADGKVSTHAALTTGVHGVGTDTINDLYDILFTRGVILPVYAGWTEAKTGSASITQSVGFVLIATGATSGSLARCYTEFIGYLGYNMEPKFEYSFKVTAITNVQIQIILGGTNDPTLANQYYVGIDILNNALRALSCDGTTRSVLDLGVALGAWSTLVIRQRLANGKLYTWVNGVAKADKTTNIPAAGNFLIFTTRITNTAAADKQIYKYAPKIVWKG